MSVVRRNCPGGNVYGEFPGEFISGVLSLINYPREIVQGVGGGGAVQEARFLQPHLKQVDNLRHNHYEQQRYSQPHLH